MATRPRGWEVIQIMRVRINSELNYTRHIYWMPISRFDRVRKRVAHIVVRIRTRIAKMMKKSPVIEAVKNINSYEIITEIKRYPPNCFCIGKLKKKKYLGTLSALSFSFFCLLYTHVLTPTMLFNSVTVICFALSTAVATCCWCSWERNGRIWAIRPFSLFDISICKCKIHISMI